MKHVAVADVAFKIDYKFLDVRPKITRIHQPNIMLPYLADSILIKSENNVQTTVRDPAILVICTYRFRYCDRRCVGCRFRRSRFSIGSHAQCEYYHTDCSSVRAVGKYSTKKVYMYFVLQSAGGRSLYSQRPLQIGPGPFQKMIR